MASTPIVLKTFIHVSDLHIGEIDPQSGDALVVPQAASVIQTFKYLDGLLGHHGRALKDLQEFCDDFARRDQPFDLLVTGDFTRCGGPAEIDVVKRYLSSHIDLNAPKGNFSGLYLGSMPPVCITGNHDQWGGVNQPWGGGPLAPGVLTQSMPIVTQHHLANGRRLLLVGIDTDADINPKGIKRILAQGSFQNQLVALAQMMPQPEPGDIRVMMSHHSMACGSLTLRMDDASLNALGAFLADNQFSIVLSGHTHDQTFNKVPIKASNGTYEFVEELTCGTTTQHDQVPYNWRSIFGAYPNRNWPENTLLVHQIVGRPGATTWETQAYARTSSGFGTLGVKFAHSVRL